MTAPATRQQLQRVSVVSSAGRNQFLLIRRLRALLERAGTGQNHLAQIVGQEGRGNCLPPRDGCHAACLEWQELMALTEPYVQPAAVRPPKPLRVVTLRPRRQAPTRPVQGDLFDLQAMG